MPQTSSSRGVIDSLYPSISCPSIENVKYIDKLTNIWCTLAGCLLLEANTWMSCIFSQKLPGCLPELSRGSNQKKQIRLRDSERGWKAREYDKLSSNNATASACQDWDGGGYTLQKEGMILDAGFRLARILWFGVLIWGVTLPWIVFLTTTSSSTCKWFSQNIL